MSEQEALPPQEQQPSKEQEIFSSHYDGLHIRLLLGGKALNPNNDTLPKVEKDKIKSFEQRKDDYQVFNQASTKERRKIAGVKEEELEQAIDNWSQKTLKVLSQDFSKRENFDQQKAQRWQETLSQFLKYIGIDDLLKATKEEIRVKIFDRYFTGENKDSNLYHFVKDILESQNNDFELIKQNIDFFQWFSNIVGVNSSILTSHLIAAESRLKHQSDQLISQANADTGKKDSQNNPIERRNNLNKEEKEVLEFVWEERSIKEQKPEAIPSSSGNKQAEELLGIQLTPEISPPIRVLSDQIAKAFEYLKDQGIKDQKTNSNFFSF